MYNYSQNIKFIKDFRKWCNSYVISIYLEKLIPFFDYNNSKINSNFSNSKMSVILNFSHNIRNIFKQKYNGKIR